MSELGFEFDVNDAPEDDGNFEPIPAGTYLADVTSCEQKDNGKGYIGLNVRCDIVEGQHSGRVVFGNVTLKCDNTTAVEIGRKQLAVLGRANGLTKVRDDQQLIGGRVKIKVGIEEYEGEKRNKIKNFALPAGGAKPQASTTGSTGGKAPWA